MEAELRHDDGKVPKHSATDILACRPATGSAIATLAPANMIMTAEGPRLVDWTFAMRAPATVD